MSTINSSKLLIQENVLNERNEEGGGAYFDHVFF